MCVDARLLPEIFEKGEIQRIYLNFSDPWPKARHAKRRLTSREFLARYSQILPDGAVVEFKTDNKGLFEFSLRVKAGSCLRIPLTCIIRKTWWKAMSWRNMRRNFLLWETRFVSWSQFFTNDRFVIGTLKNIYITGKRETCGGQEDIAPACCTFFWI